MQPTNSNPTSAHPAEQPAHEDEDRGTSFDRRVKAAGIDPDAVPEDMDEFRYTLARKIAMFVNAWHGCPERLCQRNRGCMAPNIACTNAKPLSPDWQEKEWPRVKVEVYKALKAHLAKHGEEE